MAKAELNDAQIKEVGTHKRLKNQSNESDIKDEWFKHRFKHEVQLWTLSNREMTLTYGQLKSVIYI